MTSMCPHCGFNLTAEKEFELGEWRFVPRDGVYYRGERVVTLPAWMTILTTLAQQQGRTVSSEVLQARFSDSDNSNVVQVQICRLRRALKRRRVPDPIESRYGTRGYRWRVD